MISKHGRQFASMAEIRRFESERERKRQKAREDRFKERWARLVDEDVIREPDSLDEPERPEF